MHAEAIFITLGKNYANFHAVVKICQLFISKLSTIIHSTNQILIQGAGIMERRHQLNVYRLPRAPHPSSPDRSRLVPLALDYTRLTCPKPNRTYVHTYFFNIGHFLLWSTERCQNKVSTDQYHVTISHAQV